MNYLDKVTAKRSAEAQQNTQSTERAELLRTIKRSGQSVADNATLQHVKDRNHTHKVEVTNFKDSIKTPDVKDVTEAVNRLIAVVESTRPTNAVEEGIASLKTAVEALPKGIKIPEHKPTKEVSVTNQFDYKKNFDTLTDAVKSIELQPQVTVKTPKIDIPKVDFSPIVEAIKQLEQVVNVNPAPPIVNIGMESLEEQVDRVRQAIKDLKFPVPNYVLPYRNTEGASQQATVVESTDSPGIWGVVILNPDGSSVSTATTSSTYGSGLYGTATYA